MTRTTVEGRPVFLRKTCSGWRVKWGRTVIGVYPTWKDALKEIMELFK